MAFLPLFFAIKGPLHFFFSVLVEQLLSVVDEVCIAARKVAIGIVLPIFMGGMSKLPVFFEREPYPAGRVSDVFLAVQRLKHFPDAGGAVVLDKAVHHFGSHALEVKKRCRIVVYNITLYLLIRLFFLLFCCWTLRQAFRRRFG